MKKFPLSRIQTILAIALMGALAGHQIFSPTKRVIEAVVGLLLVFVMWNFSTLAALSLVIFIYPFPFGLSIGSSNFILIVIIFLIYMIRVYSHESTIRSDKHFNIPILLLVSAYIISFYNFEMTPFKFQMSYQHTINFFASVMFFYLIINFVDTEEKLRRTVKIMMGTAALVMIFTLFEMLFPAKTLIPGWLFTRHRTALVMRNVRMGGPFGDFELMAEFAAMHAIIAFFMALRARRLATRVLFVILMFATLFFLLTTITRGAFISLAIGMIYLAFLARKDLNFVRFTMLMLGIISVMIIMEAFVTRYTISGSMFKRIIGTTFSKGIIPDTRSQTWFIAWDRAMKHPLIGHCPGGWGFGRSLDYDFWPHNVYLYYLNITGFFGLSAFLFLLYRLLKATMRGIKSSLVSAPFSESFMKILHVCLVMFMIDQIKIEYLRNLTYVFFVWLLFGLIAATQHIIMKKKREESMPVPSR